MKIEIKSATKEIKGNTVLQNINLTFDAGKIYGLQGVNGSGKTMLLRRIAGLIKPTEGKVIIDNQVLGSGLDFPKKMGLLIEGPAFLNDYSAFNNIKLICSLSNVVSDSEIFDALAAVGLNPKDKKPYKKFSLGMKQKLGICAATVEKPELILLDEPTNALDAAGFEMVENLLIRMKEMGSTIIIASHELQLLANFTDEVIFLENGKVIQKEDK